MTACSLPIQLSRPLTEGTGQMPAGALSKMRTDCQSWRAPLLATRLAAGIAVMQHLGAGPPAMLMGVQSIMSVFCTSRIQPLRETWRAAATDRGLSVGCPGARATEGRLPA